MFKVKNVMQKDVITVDSDAGVYDAIQLMLDNRVSGLPVVDKDDRLVGIVSERDLLKLIKDSNPASDKVEDHMVTAVVAFSPTDSLVDVTDCLTANGFRRVPIVEDGKVIGVVSRRDILRKIRDLRIASS